MSDREPSHVDDAINAVAELERDALETASHHQRWIESVTQAIGRPRSFYAVVAFVVLWIAINVVLTQSGGRAFDPPPFAWLQGIVALSSLLTALLILTTANRASQHDSLRDKLDLQINLLNERRMVKLIEMLDQQRRDSPALPTHDDPEVKQLSEPTDTQAVTRAIEERT